MQPPRPTVFVSTSNSCNIDPVSASFFSNEQEDSTSSSVPPNLESWLGCGWLGMKEFGERWTQIPRERKTVTSYTKLSQCIDGWMTELSSTNSYIRELGPSAARADIGKGACMVFAVW